MHTVIVSGEFPEILRQLFNLNAIGHIEFGPASSIEPIGSLEPLASGVVFRDHIMEGFVRYSLRAVQLDSGLELEVGLFGTNRDEYVIPSVRSYISWAGLHPAQGPAA